MFDRMRRNYWTVEAFAEYCDAKFGVYGSSEWILNMYIKNGEVDNEQVKQTLQLLKTFRRRMLWKCGISMPMFPKRYTRAACM